jgi:hypothetical protein
VALLTTADDFELHGATPPSTHPTCPLAREGLDSALMRRCPGFAPHPLTFTGIGAGESLGDRVTCAHLGTQRGTRGFVSACRHPGGRPVEAEALAARVRPARRSRVAAN